MNFATKQKRYWNDLTHESMPDKYYVDLEVKAIKKLLGPGKILDIGCGDGENTKKYAKIKGAIITGVDYSPNRIHKAEKENPKIKFLCIDVSKENLPDRYDYIISQRFLINLPNWQQQKQVIKKLINCLNPKGKLILCEGSIQGDQELNQFRAQLKLNPIPIHWHNRFINDEKLKAMGFKLMAHFGGFFLLTRGVRPFFDHDLNWNNRFNRLAKNIILPEKFSRIKVWQYSKNVRNSR